MRVFVTGASGFIGSAVAAELRNAGHEVTGLARSPAAADRLTALGGDVTLATLADTGSLHAAAAVCDGEAEPYFGWLAALAGTDVPASPAATRSLLAWEPAWPGLLDDLTHGEFFQGAQR
jgi:nucleoside-diphosphate-sugar epimerase